MRRLFRSLRDYWDKNPSRRWYFLALFLVFILALLSVVEWVMG